MHISDPAPRQAPSFDAAPSFLSRFQIWYDYERDCNARMLQMLNSVPVSNRGSAQFARAVGKAAHLVAARHSWLHRIGVCHDKPESAFPLTPLDQLPARFADIEGRWTAYLGSLKESDVLADVTWIGNDGKRRRYPMLELLTQIFGHAWYHRGQIASLVKDLGGEPVDADYIFWNRPTVEE